MNIPYVMIKCLSLTIIFELLLAFFLSVRNLKDYLNIVLVNIITNPLVVTIPIYIQIKYGLTARWIILLMLEIMTIIFEGFIYKKYLNYKKMNPYLLSLILNGASYLIGEIINYGLKGVL